MILRYIYVLTIHIEKMTLTFIDLFCGIGGFHQALTKLGCKCVLACDIDKNCREVYKRNYGIEPVSDVRTIDSSTLGHVDIICGGFPCQTFSNAGNKKMFEDERGLLFDEIIKICLVKKPKFMFLENVKHILKVGNGEVIKYIKNKIHKAGYNLQIFNMSPHNYGIPQQRERVYFVCVRKDLYNGNEIQLPSFSKKICLTKFLEKDIPKKYYLDGDILKVLEAWDEMIKVFEVGEKLSPNILIHEVYNDHTEEDFENFATWKKDYITKNKPLIKKYKPKFDVWYKKHEELLKKRIIFGKLEWQVGKVKPDDSIFNYFIQIRQSGIRVKKAEYFPTLVAISQIPIYGKEKRYITPRECANLQSFPESFVIPENDRHSYKQFGNSVNVDNVKTVIESTFKHYGFT
jgi:DNA (cytosine-5)-methyltransferase 1